MNELDLLSAVGSIDGELVERAAEPKKKNSGRALLIAASIAAALALAAGVFAIVLSKTEAAPEGDGKEASATEAEAPENAGVPANMYSGYVKYNGKAYIFMMNLPASEDIEGEFLAEITHRIKPDTPPEEAPELSGYKKGSICALKGFDPEHMICMPDGETISLFIDWDSYDYSSGEKVLEGVFHASEYMRGLIYESGESVENGYDERFVMDGDGLPLAREMLAALGAGEWTEPIMDVNEHYRISCGLLWDFTLDLGAIDLGLSIYEGGYAGVHMTNALRFIRFDEARIAPFLEYLSEGCHGEPAELSDNMRNLRPEALRGEPRFGKYFPETPGGFRLERATIVYEQSSGSEPVDPGKVRLLTAEYRGVENEDAMIKITVRSKAELTSELLGADEDKRSDAPIEELDASTVKVSGSGCYEVTGYDENAAITIHAYDSLTPEEIAALMHECFGK